MKTVNCFFRKREKSEEVFVFSSFFFFVYLLSLDETEVGDVFTEALTADVEAVLADESLLVTAHLARASTLTLVDKLTRSPLFGPAHVEEESGFFLKSFFSCFGSFWIFFLEEKNHWIFFSMKFCLLVL